ncbi:MAG: carboxymuconolactone decarboxylase family protein, partial [Dehalococcoidia bacterium]|nr:carboxymuconolactone decarboxylase family protein [Dehalococcoidia bacterium]
MVRSGPEPTPRIATGKFNKRTYQSPGELFADIFFLTKNLRQIRGVMRGDLISSAFRERLMLLVTSVYGCRYCSWFHTREALRSGVDKDEISSLLAGSVDDCPQDEAVALLYAQHWADSDTRPDPEACARLEQAYGAEKAGMINLVLRINRVGNLSGNT